MIKSILIVVSGFLMLFFFNGAGCEEPPFPFEVRSRIELRGLQYDIVKIELSQFSENISGFFSAVEVGKPEALTGVSVKINNKKIKVYDDNSLHFDIREAIKAKKPVLIHADITKLDYLDFEFWGFLRSEKSLGSTFFYRLKVDTDGLEANKNLFDKKIQFTPEDSETFIRIDIANKKIDIRHFFLCIPFCEN